MILSRSKLFLASFLAAATIALAACDVKPAYSPIPAATGASDVAPVATQQGGFDAGSAALGAVAGGLAGAALGSAMTKNSQPHQVVVQQPTPQYYGGPSRYYSPKPTITQTTTVKKSLFGNKITKTTTIRKR